MKKQRMENNSMNWFFALNASGSSFTNWTESPEVEDPRILASSYTMYKIGEVIKQFFFPIFIPVGVVGNFLSFLVMIQSHNREVSFSLYISALAISDTMVLLNGIGVYLDEVLGVDMPPNKHWYCCIQMYNYVASFLCSAYLLIAMTFERFYSIIRPHKAASFNTAKRPRIIIIFIFIFYFTYAIPFLFIGGHNGIACVINRFASDNVLGEMHHWLNEAFVFIFPFLSLLTMNSVIIHTLRERSKQNILGSGSQDENGDQYSRNKHPEKQIVTMLLLVTFVFLTLNLPVRSAVFYINFTHGNTPYYYAGLHLFYQVAVKAFYTNHGINFFLYVISGQKFRTDLRNLFLPKKQNKNFSLGSDGSTIASSVSSKSNIG